MRNDATSPSEHEMMPDFAHYCPAKKAGLPRKVTASISPWSEAVGASLRAFPQELCRLGCHGTSERHGGGSEEKGYVHAEHL